MPPILISFSAKRIATEILWVLSYMEDRVLFWEVVILIWSFPANNYLFQVTKWSTRTTCENCLQELRNRISCIISVWSLFCWVQNYISLYFYSPSLWWNYVFVFQCFLFFVCLYLWFLVFTFSDLCFEFNVISKDLIKFV